MKNINSNILEHATLFTLTLCSWGNRAKGSLEDATFLGDIVPEITADASPEETASTNEPDKKRLSLSKRLIKSDEYKAVRKAQSELKKWCMQRCMPSFLKDGIFIVGLEQVKEFEMKLAEAKQQIREVLVPVFLQAYPKQVEDAREALGNLFLESDYPSIEQLRKSFNLHWSWISFSVPDTLPEGVRQQEIEKLQKRVQDAQIEIIASLRGSFGELVSHMVDKLKPDTSGKKKIIKEAFIENFRDFFNTFDARNLMDDTELAASVGKARALLENVSAEGLRASADLRQNIVDQFETVKVETDKLIIEIPSRRFDFEEEN
ncbi:MAG: hypothetical protein IMZ53_12770 [Thermoplasmata archaeon]|nr:hypothetical protein [Thermoplasmata archaeon]